MSITFSDDDLASLHSGDFPARLSRLIRYAVLRVLRSGELSINHYCDSDVDDLCQAVSLRVYTMALSHDTLRNADRWFGVTVWRCSKFATVEWLRGRELVPLCITSGRTISLWGVDLPAASAADPTAEMRRLKKFILANISERRLQVAAFALACSDSVVAAARYCEIDKRTMYRRIESLRDKIAQPAEQKMTRVVCEALQACLSSDLQGA